MAETDDLDKFVGWAGRLPQGWVQLPLDPAVDAEAWARAYVAEAAAGLAPEPGEAGADVAAAMLAHFTGVSRAAVAPGVAAPLALAFLPNVMDRVLAVVTAAAYPDSDEPAPEPTADDGPDLDVSRVDLALGPTLRIRRVQPEEEVGDRGWLEATLLERLTYVSTPPGLPGFTVVEAVWADLVLGDAIAEHVDALLSGLRIEFQQ